VCISVHADTIGLHTFTWHDKPGFCNVNPGGYYKSNSDLTLGAYRNSECKFSTYAGMTWETTGSVRFGITVGAVSGYRLKPILPLVIPSVSVSLGGGYSMRVLAAPKIIPSSATAVHFTIERKL